VQLLGIDDIYNTRTLSSWEGRINAYSSGRAIKIHCDQLQISLDYLGIGFGLALDMLEISLGLTYD